MVEQHQTTVNPQSKPVMLDHEATSKLSFMPAKVGRFASEEVFLSLFRAKCTPVLLYAVEACPVSKRNKKSFDFNINRIFMKLFRTGSVALVEDCQRFLNVLPVSYQVDVRTAKFLQKYKATENRICSLFGHEADRQLRNLCTIYKIINQIRENIFSNL